MNADDGASPRAALRAPTAVRRLRTRLAFAAAPSRDIHPSWLPADWPLGHRRVARLNASGHEALSAWLRSTHTLPEVSECFTDAPSLAERLAWIDARDLRRLSLVCGFMAHRAQFERRDIAPELWRQGRRLQPDLGDFALSRWPGSVALSMSERSLLQRPQAIGRLVVLRGYRLMLGCFAAEGDALLRRARLKFPRRASHDIVVPLTGARRAVYLELAHMCVIPERFPQWDWLF